MRIPPSLCGVDHRQNSDVVQSWNMGVWRNRTVFNSDDLRKRELECLRFAAECMQLVHEVRSPTLQRHFLGMARAWTTEAEKGSGTDGCPTTRL